MTLTTTGPLSDPIPFPGRDLVTQIKGATALLDKSEATKQRLDSKPKVLYLVDYQEKYRNNPHLRPDLTRKFDRRKKNPMALSYLPNKYEEVASEFPSNEELNEAGFEPNSAVLRTRLRGSDEMELSTLKQMVKVDADGKPVPAYSNTELMLKIMTRCIKSWTFTCEEGGVAEINEENLLDLYQEDFDYLAEKFSVVMERLAKVKQAPPKDGEGEQEPSEETAPHTGLTEEEKNSSPDGSTNESEPSA